MTAPRRPLRLIFSFPRGRGHLGPLLPLARAARDAGHLTTLIGAREAVLEQTDFTHLHPRDVSLPASTAGTGTLQPFDPDQLLQRVEEVFIGDEAYATIEDVGSLIQSWSADVVICGEFDFGAMVAAERAGVPHVVVTAFATARNSWRESIRSPIQELRRSAGLDPDLELHMLDGNLTVVPFPPSMRPSSDFSGSMIRMRPEAPRPVQPRAVVDWFRASEDQFRVYVTLGTEFNTKSGDLFARILEGLAGLPARVLVTTGPWVDPKTIRLPATHACAQLRLEQYVPQAEVVRHADLVVNHGGSGSVVGALSFGVPVLVLPLGADQVPNGRYVTTLGAGATLDALTATPYAVRAVASRILASLEYRSAARMIRDEMFSLPGVDQVLEQIERLAAR